MFSFPPCWGHKIIHAVTSSTWTWRRLCCVPNFVIFLLTLACLLAAVALVVLSDVFSDDVGRRDSPLQPVLIALASVVGVVLLTNLYTWVRMLVLLFRSHHRRIHSYLAHVDASSGGYMEALKGEIELMSAMVSVRHHGTIFKRLLVDPILLNQKSRSWGGGGGGGRLTIVRHDRIRCALC